ncbi:hypothetical protein ACFE04_011704 [Oxalis oulophora]
MSLMGPPALYRTAPPPPQSPPQVSDPFIDLMVANFNKTSINRPNLGLTENGSATFTSSGNPCLDFFFHVVPDTPSFSLNERLETAWAHDPLITLKLVCNLRGVRGTGKSDKNGFYTAAFWLHKHHPKTFASNLESFAEFGYFKDLPEILYRLLEGSDVRDVQKNEWLKRKNGGGLTMGKRKFAFSSDREQPQGRNTRRKAAGSRDQVSREVRVLNEAVRCKIEKEKASELRHKNQVEMAKKVIQRIARDPDFRFLYDQVSDLFVKYLKKDLEILKSEKYNDVSLAAKWCPSIDSSFDRAMLLCESIARKLFPRESCPEYEGVDEEHYAYRVRDRLRKEILVPLRKVLELPEVYIGLGKFDALPYNRVASVAMKLHKKTFFKYDKERFTQYLEDVKSGKAKIAAGALLPHEIVNSLNDYDVSYNPDDQVAELQWQRMVNDMLEIGQLKNCLAVSDVSGSMHGTPMEVSIALGVLVSELSEDPWKGKIITFSENPILNVIRGTTLREKTKFVEEMEWGYNTDFQKVFDLILKVAVDGNLKPEQMIKRLFVFSDMEFDEASPNPWETDYDCIVRKFIEKGYGNCVPEIVFWNLRDSSSTPVPQTQKGVALVSGFSKNIMKIFLGKGGEIDPISVMMDAISGEEYGKLAVID